LSFDASFHAARLARIGLVVVEEQQHTSQSLLVVLGKPAASGELVGLLEGPEEAVPPGDVAVVEIVNVELVMDRVVLWPLQEVTKPARSADVAVVEVLAQSGEDVEPPSGEAPSNTNIKALAMIELAAISTGCL
jgi:hypothetical protein